MTLSQISDAINWQARKRFGERQDFDLNPDVLVRAMAIANLRMQDEIAPLLRQQHSRPKLWHPLRSVGVAGQTAMKLWMPDPMVTEILRTPKLLEQVEVIVRESIVDGALELPKDFVTTLLDGLMSNDG